MAGLGLGPGVGLGLGLGLGLGATKAGTVTVGGGGGTAGGGLGLHGITYPAASWGNQESDAYGHPGPALRRIPSRLQGTACTRAVSEIHQEP